MPTTKEGTEYGKKSEGVSSTLCAPSAFSAVVFCCLLNSVSSFLICVIGVICGSYWSVLAQTASAQPTLFIIGDSTVKNSTTGLQGWGDHISNLFDPSRIRIENRARGGRSSRTFQTEGLWDQIVAELKTGDFVLMQFGHNDGGPINDTSRARGSLRGTGEETEEIDNLLTGKHEVVHTYGWYIRKYIRDTKAKGAIPIVLSQVPRTIWKSGKVDRVANTYGGWAAEAAKSEGAFFFDLNDFVALQYEIIGEEKVRKEFFLTDHTHTTPQGAQFNAQAVAFGISRLKNCPLAKFLLRSK
jgi:rhamnogalacturonan acetylesterase